MRAEQSQVTFGSSVIDYRVERSNRRNIVTIAVEPTGTVLIKAPAEASVRRLDDVVRAKAPWIHRQLVELRDLGSGPVAKEFVAGESYSYLGRTYRLRILQSHEVRVAAAALHGAFLTVCVSPGDRPDNSLIKGAIVGWYRRQGLRRLPERVATFAARVGVREPIVLVREQAKRWGSCSSEGALRFNWRIMMAPMSLVDYVVAHEVCHLVIKDHSNRFWRLLGRVLPDFEERRAKLRAEGQQYQL